jgi:hypothetical protein
LAGPGRSLSGVPCRGLQTCFGRNRDPVGATQSKQNDAVPQGAGLAPKREPEERTGYGTRATPIHRSQQPGSQHAEETIVAHLLGCSRGMSSSVSFVLELVMRCCGTGHVNRALGSQSDYKKPGKDCCGGQNPSRGDLPIYRLDGANALGRCKIKRELNGAFIRS